MDYLKIIKNDSYSISCNYYTKKEFDTCGYMARIKVTDGTLYICSGKSGRYPIEKGETIDFVGKMSYYGNAEIHYILFDKV